MDDPKRRQLYDEASASFAPALDRLARAYEADEERRRDLLQEIYVALWRSLAAFDGRCSLRTWTFRVAHNVASSHVRAGRIRRFKSLEELAEPAAAGDLEEEVAERSALERLLALVRSLEPLDRQVMTLWLEDVDAAAIAEVSGLSAANVAVRVHRVKKLLAKRFHGTEREGTNDG